MKNENYHLLLFYIFMELWKWLDYTIYIERDLKVVTRIKISIKIVDKI